MVAASVADSPRAGRCEGDVAAVVVFLSGKDAEQRAFTCTVFLAMRPTCCPSATERKYHRRAQGLRCFW